MHRMQYHQCWDWEFGDMGENKSPTSRRYSKKIVVQMQCQGCSWGKTKQAFLSVKLSFLLNCSFKITPRVCFPEQFELVVRSFSASEIRHQPRLAASRPLISKVSEASFKEVAQRLSEWQKNVKDFWSLLESLTTSPKGILTQQKFKQGGSTPTYNPSPF